MEKVADKIIEIKIPCTTCIKKDVCKYSVQMKTYIEMAFPGYAPEMIETIEIRCIFHNLTISDFRPFPVGVYCGDESLTIPYSQK